MSCVLAMQILLQHLDSFSNHQGTYKTNNSNVLLSYVFCSDFKIKRPFVIALGHTTRLWKTNITGSYYCAILMHPLAMQVPCCCQSCFTEVSHTWVTWTQCKPCMCVYTAVAAGGLYSGEVVVWDTSRTKDPVLVQSGMSADSHREPVYHVSL